MRKEKYFLTQNVPGKCRVCGGLRPCTKAPPLPRGGEGGMPPQGISRRWGQGSVSQASLPCVSSAYCLATRSAA